jgi:hypothetical protein
MMDLYYGQAGTALHTFRIPAIAEFVHYAMDFAGPFNMNESGLDAYMRTFNTLIEGWDDRTPARRKYDNLTATKEMSRIIRWGIIRFGGKIVFEGRQVYYEQVFDPTKPRVSDTDLEAQELFQFFQPGLSTAPMGKGAVTFYWGGRETVPTKLHFFTNWTFANGRTHVAANMRQFSRRRALRPIWNNFLDLPRPFVWNSDIIDARELFGQVSAWV